MTGTERLRALARWLASGASVAIAGVAIAGLLICSAAAWAAPAPRILLRDISYGAPQPCGIGDIDLETQLADNPRNPNDVVIDFMRGPAPGPGITILTTSSQDGGNSWRPTTVRNIACTGAPANTSADPWVSFGPDGKAYLALGLDYAGESEGAPFEPTGEWFAQSTSGGQVWSAPEPVQPQEGTDFFDKASVTADPYRTGRAYYIFSRRPLPAGTDGQVMLSRTTDGGATWSPPKLIYSAPQLKSVWGNTIFVLRDGTLVDVFNQNSNAFGAGAVLNEPSAGDIFERESYVNEMMAIRSTDGGATWSAPVQLGVASNDWPQNSATGEIARLYAYGTLESAIGPDGTIYAAWCDNRPAGISRVLFSRSRDGGRTWSAPRTIHAAPVTDVFGSAIAVSPDGTVGTIYYDDRRGRPSASSWPIDVWFSESHDGGATWQEAHLGGPFDLHHAALTTFIPYPKFRELGDFVGMTGLPGGFGASFTMVTPTDKGAPSDVYFARIWTSAPPPACVDGRHLVIRLSVPRGDRLRSARVYVNGRLRQVLRGAHLGSAFAVKGDLPAGLVTVRVSALTADGRHLAVTRQFRTCKDADGDGDGDRRSSDAH